MKAYKLIEDCLKELNGEHEYDIFLKAFQCNMKHPHEDVRSQARHAYEVWIKDQTLPQVVWDFAVNVLDKAIKKTKQKGTA